ncbi:MAG: hypothetical protein HY717_11520 [Planctomycetes bacterium]|nr:hypothetical protein [Planctomycetota bacterium]
MFWIERTEPYRIFRRVGVIAGAVLLSWLTWLSGAARGDSIVLVTGSILKDVQIDKAGWDTVSYKIGNNPQAIEGKKVAGIERSSTWLSPIRAALSGGDFAAAAKAIEKPMKDVQQFGKDWEKSEAAYLLGKFYFNWANEEPSKVGEAVKHLKAYLETNKGTRDINVPPATYALGKAQLLAGNPADAEAQFKSLNEYGGEKTLWSYRAKVGLAWAKLKSKGGGNGNGEALEARKLFLEVLEDKSAPAEVQQEAAVGRAETFNAKEQYDEAVRLLAQRFFRPGAAQEVPYNEHYAEACNVMGDAYRLRKTKENLEEAELWYLRTTCFCKNFPGAYRRAVRGLIEVYDKLGKKERAKEWQAK